MNKTIRILCSRCRTERQDECQSGDCEFEIEHVADGHHGHYGTTYEIYKPTKPKFWWDHAYEVWRKINE